MYQCTVSYVRSGNQSALTWEGGGGRVRRTGHPVAPLRATLLVQAGPCSYARSLTRVQSVPLYPYALAAL
jgi:hypothetical protein